MEPGLHRTAAMLPDEAALRARVAAVWELQRMPVLQRLEPYVQQLQSAQPTLLQSIGWVMLVALGLSLVLWPVALYGTLPVWFASVVAPGTLLASTLVAGALGLILYRVYRYWQAYQHFVRVQNEQLFPLLGEVFQCLAMHHQTAIDHLSVQAVLREVTGAPQITSDMVTTLVQLSGLYTDQVTTYETDDVLELTVANRTLLLAELRLQITQQRDKHQETTTLFSGLFVHYPLARPLVGQTYVSTEGDKHGFAHRTFWNALTGMAGVAETVLESNAFERDLHVASSDPTEARYILTPDFMEHLHDWWQEHRQNVRIAFKGQEFFMLLPDAHIRFKTAPSTRNDDRVVEYLYSLARPVWRTFRLVEDMRL